MDADGYCECVEALGLNQFSAAESLLDRRPHEPLPVASPALTTSTMVSIETLLHRLGAAPSGLPPRSTRARRQGGTPNRRAGERRIRLSGVSSRRNVLVKA